MGREFSHNVAVVGGCGRAGLPLGIAFASRGHSVVLHDLRADQVDFVNRGVLPFAEQGAADLLKDAVRSGALTATTDVSAVSTAENVVFATGTPVGEHLDPDLSAVASVIEHCRQHLRARQLVILRSTVFPGATAAVERMLADVSPDIDVAFCPERMAEGRAMTEIFTLPQIVGARTPAVHERAGSLFERLTPSVLRTTPEEAELAKLFTNAWRYIKFAAANQFYMMANSAGVEFEQVRWAMTTDYPRAADVPGAGFAAGPCLFKDTMQLSAFSNNQFALGHAAMLVNEGLPLYVVSRLEQRLDLEGRTIGILGMAFKGDSDDTRSSLSYKLRRILEFRSARVVCTDPNVTSDASLLPLDEVLNVADVIMIAAPHREYRGLEIPPKVEVVDIWDVLGRGTLV